MSVLTGGQKQFVSHLAGATGLNPGVLTSWVLAEESGSAAQQRQAAGNHDWLNIGYTDSQTYGGKDSVWSNPVSAAEATAGWLKGKNTVPGYGKASSGVQSILHTAGSSPMAQINAIASSGWASSGYNGGATLRSLFYDYGKDAPGAAASTGGAAGATASAVQRVAQQRAGSAPQYSVKQAGGKTNWGSAITDALLQTPAINVTTGTPSDSTGLLQRAENLVSSNPTSYTSPVTQKLVAVQRAGSALSNQAVNDAAHAGASSDAQQLLRMLHNASGGPYSQANHNAVAEHAGQIKSQGTDCSGLISWLMGPHGLGIWHTSLATPSIDTAPGMQAGRGKTITVWNNKQAGNAGHVFIQIGNQFWASEGGTGVGQISAAEAKGYIQHGSDGGTYEALHPKGL